MCLFKSGLAPYREKSSLTYLKLFLKGYVV